MGRQERKHPFHRLPLGASALLAAAWLSGCTLSGGGLDDLVDSSIATGSIQRDSASATEPDQLSDRATVRNAVSAADLSAAAVQPLAWANADTGASGEITEIREVRRGGEICRSFTTSRQRFDGVSLFTGEACTAGKGEWLLTQFAEGR